jgi:HD-like signal output (HDOD) protein
VNDNRLEERLSGIEGLPTLPIVLQQIQRVINHPGSNMAQIAAVVGKDQSLTSRVIRLVNSAWYTRTTRVASIQQAIVTLGLKTLNNLMIGLSVVNAFDSTKILGYDPQKFWEHTFGTAILAEKISLLIAYRGDRSECFIAGLLHDMGRLVLEQFMHDDYVVALQKASEVNKPLLTHEMEVFGFSHADAGAWLGQKWNIPSPLIAAMKYHHCPEKAVDIPPAERDLVRIVAAANELATAGTIGTSGERHLVTNVATTIQKLTAETRIKMIDETRQEVITTLNEWNRS